MRKLYKTILADPPWETLQTGGRGAVHHYELMTLNEIKSMPMFDLADTDSHCWLWVTNAVLEHGYEVLRAWGFVPRSVFTWVKPRLGMGSYLRNCTEHMLFGTRGKAPMMFNAQQNWGYFPIQGHSHKPEEAHRIIERCSPGPFLELFARRRQPFWDVWGNEIDSDVIIPGYDVPSYSEAIYQGLFQ